MDIAPYNKICPWCRELILEGKECVRSTDPIKPILDEDGRLCGRTWEYYHVECVFPLP